MNKKFLQSKKSLLLIFLAFLLSLNYALMQKSFYLDLTEDKLYTASAASRDILGNLPEPVAVTFYVSRDLPADFVVLKTQLEDILNQYQDLAHGKLSVRYETPADGEQAAGELAGKGIQQLQSQVVAKDKIEVKNFFFGAVISQGEGEKAKTEVLPGLSQLESFEYDFISAVNSVSRQEKETVAFLSGHEEKTVDATELKKSYAVKNVTISTAEGKHGFVASEKLSTSSASEAAAPEESVSPKTLIIAAPAAKLSAEELAVLDEFVAAGGKVVVLAEKVNFDTALMSQGFFTKKSEGNIGDFTKKYGIEIRDDLVYDRSNAVIPLGYYGFNYPFWVKAVRENFSGHPALAKTQSLTFLWASSLAAAGAEGYEVEPLVSSSDAASTQTENFNINPNAELSYANGGQQVLAAIATGKEKGGQVVVIGDGDFVSPGFLNPISDNEIFFLNLVDSVSSPTNLSSIRAKNISARPLKELTESEKNSWKFFSILGGPLLLGAYGFLRINRRRKLSRNS